MAHYTGGYVVIDDTADTILGSVTNISVPTGIATEALAKSGEPYPRTVGLTGIDSTATFTTKNLATFIDAFGVFGYNVGTPANGVKIYCAQAAEGGQRTSGSAHMMYTFNEGVLFPTTLSASQGQAATLEYNALLTYDGSNAPIVATASQALPTAPTSDVEYDIAPWKVGAYTITGIQSASIEFGIQAQAVKLEGAYYPTFAYIQTMTPRVRISTVNLDNLGASAVPYLGLAGTHANSIGYFRKRALGVGHVADGTAEHISIVFAGVAHVENVVNVSGEGGGLATCDIVIDVYYDGTNLPFVIDTTAAIA